VGLSPSLGTGGGPVGCEFHNGETLVSIFCRLGNTMKKCLVISWPSTKGSIRWAK
jgi:hypothetical protein